MGSWDYSKRDMKGIHEQANGYTAENERYNFFPWWIEMGNTPVP